MPVEVTSADVTGPADGVPVVVDIVGSGALVVYSVVASVSFAALVFTGPASGGLPRGAATFLLASGVITILLGLRSRFSVAFGVVQDTAAIVLVPAVATLVASGSDDPVRDVFVVLAASAMLTGCLMWLLGQTGLSAASRFMPTTVVSGFLAGTGWLLTKGGFDVMTGTSLQVGDLDDLVGFDLARFWLPGVALGAVIVTVPLFHRIPPLLSSLATLGAIVAFFAVVQVASSVSAVEEGGWLLGPFADGGSVRFVFSDIADSDWSAVSDTIPQLGVVVILSLLGVLLNISGIQALLRQRVDLDVELRTVGIANMLIAPIGGLVGYHGLGDSALADRLGVRRSWSPLVVGAATSVFAFVGSSAVGYIPKFVAGGLLVGAGVGMLIAWVTELRSTTGWSDRWVSIVILAVICFVGILEGIVVGIVAACLFFVVRYSRIDAIRLVSTGHERRSVVQRSAVDIERLVDSAGHLAVYELHGSLFFGSVSGVAETIRERLSRPAAPIDVVVVDFARVADIDSSAYTVLTELAVDVAAADARLIWSQLPTGAATVLARAQSDAVDEASDLDLALEAAEDHLLSLTAEAVEESDVAHADGARDGDAPGYSDALLEFFESRRHEAGDVLMSEGDPSDELLVVMAGEVRASRIDRTGRQLRLRTLRAGSSLGEIGFLTKEPRSATVTAETDGELRVLTAEAHERLRRERPELVIELYDRVLQSTAARAADINRSLTQALR
jgi:SulP family sulfate permease